MKDLDVAERIVRVAARVHEREGREWLAVRGREVIHDPRAMFLVGAVDDIDRCAVQRWIRLDLSLQVTREELVALDENEVRRMLETRAVCGERPTYASSMMSGDPARDRGSARTSRQPSSPGLRHARRGDTRLSLCDSRPRQGSGLLHPRAGSALAAGSQSAPHRALRYRLRIRAAGARQEVHRYHAHRRDCARQPVRSWPRGRGPSPATRAARGNRNGRRVNGAEPPAHRRER